MTLTIEVIDEVALHHLKEMEEKNEIRVMQEDNKPLSAKQEPTDEKRSANIRALRGAIPYDEEKYKAQMQFLQEIRNEWDR